MNELFRLYTAEHLLIREESYIYQLSNTRKYCTLENVYGCVISQNSDCLHYSAESTWNRSGKKY